MKEFRYVITDPVGIHARPAGELVKAAKQYGCSIQMEKGERRGDCKKIFGVMGLAVKKGNEVRMIFDGSDEEEACRALEAFMKANL